MAWNEKEKRSRHGNVATFRPNIPSTCRYDSKLYALSVGFFYNMCGLWWELMITTISKKIVYFCTVFSALRGL